MDRPKYSVFEKNKNLAIANRSRVGCAQYAEGIYDNPLTLKSRLMIKVTGHGTIE